VNILQRALFPTLLIFLFFLSGISASAHTLDLHSGKVVSLDTMIDDLLQSRVVFIGQPIIWHSCRSFRLYITEELKSLWRWKCFVMTVSKR